jgi:predicted RNase H-like HicB family nuclease
MKTPTRDYSILIEYADDGFVTRVPDLPGCISEGETAEEALAGIDAAIKEWIAQARVRGEPIPDPSNRRMTAKWTSN